MHTDLERSEKTPSSREHVLEQVRQLVAEQIALPPGVVREEHDLVADLGYDSLDVVELAMELEEHFEITVPDTMSEQARTVGQIADGVMQVLQIEMR
jgi:acyl carrier protein